MRTFAQLADIVDAARPLVEAELVSLTISLRNPLSPRISVHAEKPHASGWGWDRASLQQARDAAAALGVLDPEVERGETSDGPYTTVRGLTRDGVEITVFGGAE